MIATNGVTPVVTPFAFVATPDDTPRQQCELGVAKILVLSLDTSLPVSVTVNRVDYSPNGARQASQGQRPG